MALPLINREGSDCAFRFSMADNDDVLKFLEEFDNEIQNTTKKQPLKSGTSSNNLKTPERRRDEQDDVVSFLDSLELTSAKPSLKTSDQVAGNSNAISSDLTKTINKIPVMSKISLSSQVQNHTIVPQEPLETIQPVNSSVPSPPSNTAKNSQNDNQINERKVNEEWSWGGWSSVLSKAADATSKGLSSATTLAKTVVADQRVKTLMERGGEELSMIKSDFSLVAKKLTETIAPPLEPVQSKISVWLCCQLKSESILNNHHDFLQKCLNEHWLIQNRGFTEQILLNSCVDDDVLTGPTETEALERINVTLS